jgi:hypothetical protein
MRREVATVAELASSGLGVAVGNGRNCAAQVPMIKPPAQRLRSLDVRQARLICDARTQAHPDSESC